MNVGSGSTKKENPGPNHCERVQKGPVRVRTLEPLILISKNYKKILDYTTSWPRICGALSSARVEAVAASEPVRTVKFLNMMKLRAKYEWEVGVSLSAGCNHVWTTLHVIWMSNRSKMCVQSVRLRNRWEQPRTSAHHWEWNKHTYITVNEPVRARTKCKKQARCCGGTRTFRIEARLTHNLIWPRCWGDRPLYEY